MNADFPEEIYEKYYGGVGEIAEHQYGGYRRGFDKIKNDEPDEIGYNRKQQGVIPILPLGHVYFYLFTFDPQNRYCNR